MRANAAVRLGVAKRIKELRLQRGWSQEQLAEHAGNTPKHISQIERGKINPRLDSLASIARGLAVDLADLFPTAKAAGTPVCLLTPQELERIDDALRIVARARRRRAVRRIGT